MIKGLYLISAGAYSGKTLIALGLMDFLVGHSGRIGFFRPVLRQAQEHDAFITLARSRFGLSQAPETMYGCSIDEAREMLVEGRRQELYSLILERYKSVEAQCDFVVCAGTDYTDGTASVELEFNMEMANHLGLPVLPVISGADKTLDEIANTTQLIAHNLLDHGCEPLAMVVAHVDADQQEGVLAKLEEVFYGEFPVYVLAEHPRLDKPTLGEIAEALQAEKLSGSDELLDNLVEHVRIAAMELPRFLGYLRESNLIITPGDRSDIILGTLTAELSGQFPQIVGLILTGGLRPDPQILRILEGLPSAVPVFSVETDTFTTAIAVHNVRCSIGPNDRRKIAAALGLVDASIDMMRLMGRVALAQADHVTPLMFQYTLIQRAKRARKHIVLPEGMDERVLRAAEIVLLREICDITLLGNPVEIKRKINALGLSLERAKIVDPMNSEWLEPFADTYYELRQHRGISRQIAHDTLMEPSYFGTMMAHLGYADGMVSGAVNTTANTIRPALEFVKTKPGIRNVSSVFFMCLADQVLVYGDCAVIPDPSAEQLADIAISSADTAKSFGIEPLVAMLSYSTGASGQGPEVDKVREATRLVKERRPDLQVEGPLQYDAAIDIDVAKLKLPGSKVAGHATVFIFPDLNAGNNAYKAVQRAADAIAIGPVLQGLNKPVNDLSRGALVPDIVNTIAITAIQAQL